MKPMVKNTKKIYFNHFLYYFCLDGIIFSWIPKSCCKMYQLHYLCAKFCDIHIVCLLRFQKGFWDISHHKQKNQTPFIVNNCIFFCCLSCFLVKILQPHSYTAQRFTLCIPNKKYCKSKRQGDLFCTTNSLADPAFLCVLKNKQVKPCKAT